MASTHACTIPTCPLEHGELAECAPLNWANLSTIFNQQCAVHLPGGFQHLTFDMLQLRKDFWCAQLAAFDCFVDTKTSGAPPGWLSTCLDASRTSGCTYATSDASPNLGSLPVATTSNCSNILETLTIHNDGGLHRCIQPWTTSNDVPQQATWVVDHKFSMAEQAIRMG
jgi:hypothetical protein